MPNVIDSLGFAEFWERTQRQWKSLPAAHRNHIKRLGLAPDKEVSKRAYIILKSMPPIQTELYFSTYAEHANEAGGSWYA